MVRPEKHVFVCINERPVGSPKGSCAQKGSLEFFSALKTYVVEQGLKSKFKITKSSCLGPCHLGISMVVYPEGSWYGEVTELDIKEFVEEHLINDRPVTRLLINV